MSAPHETIARACAALDRDDDEAAARVIRAEYPFLGAENPGRSYTPRQMMGIFLRDGFVDRYDGGRLVFPPVLRLLSMRLPEAFPAHPNWKMSESHQGFWELHPTIDHVVPVSRGGADEEANWVTTSMANNQAKGNSLLAQLRWSLHPPGDPGEWDGLTRWFLRHVETRPERLSTPYLRRWSGAARSVLEA